VIAATLLVLALQEAPEIRPELLCVARVGGKGDQWLNQVAVKGFKVHAAGDADVKVSVELLPDGSVKTKAWGNTLAAQQPRSGLPHLHAGRVGSVEYGFNQVAPLLQQPFLKGPGWQLWGWTEAQAKASKAPYAPFMADSGIRLVLPMPNKNLYAVGLCDGGNTSLRAHPKDIHRSLDFPIAFGGGGGQSSYAFEITPKGELVRQMVLRGSANGAAWDAWGRVLVVGRGIVRGDDKEAHAAFGYGDGGGLLLADAEWTRPLFKACFNHVSLWSASVDSESGLAAVVGFVDGDIKELHPVQAKPGGGKDGFIAVLRLWEGARPRSVFASEEK
jgi:hypothetical protein